MSRSASTRAALSTSRRKFCCAADRARWVSSVRVFEHTCRYLSLARSRVIAVAAGPAGRTACCPAPGISAASARPAAAVGAASSVRPASEQLIAVERLFLVPGTRAPVPKHSRSRSRRPSARPGSGRSERPAHSLSSGRITESRIFGRLLAPVLPGKKLIPGLEAKAGRRQRADVFRPAGEGEIADRDDMGPGIRRAWRPRSPNV